MSDKVKRVVWKGKGLGCRYRLILDRNGWYRFQGRETKGDPWESMDNHLDKFPLSGLEEAIGKYLNDVGEYFNER